MGVDFPRSVDLESHKTHNELGSAVSDQKRI